jgi:hypothetical protein
MCICVYPDALVQACLPLQVKRVDDLGSAFGGFKKSTEDSIVTSTRRHDDHDKQLKEQVCTVARNCFRSIRDLQELQLIP